MNDLVAFDLNEVQASKGQWEILIPNSNEGGLLVGQVPSTRTNHSVVAYNDKFYL